MLGDLLADETYREELAKAAYYRERHEDAAREAEHEVEDGIEYLALSWESLSDHARRPYRTTVAHVCAEVAAVAAAA